MGWEGWGTLLFSSSQLLTCVANFFNFLRKAKKSEILCEMPQMLAQNVYKYYMGLTHSSLKN